MRKLFFSLIAALLIPALAMAQNAPSKAKIYIKKNENGQVTELEKEIEIPAGQDIQQILNDLDIWNEIPTSPEVQRIEINVEKLGLDPMNQDLEVIMMYPGMDVPKRAFLGVMLVDSKEKAGVLINKVIPGTAAEKIGLLEGDIIYEFDGQSVTQTAQLVDEISSRDAGEEVQIRFYRANKKMKEKVTLGEKKREMNKEIRVFRNSQEPIEMQEFDWNTEDPAIFEFEMDEFDGENEFNIATPGKSAFLGITPGPASENGVQIGSVIEESSAKSMGLLQGDVIISINGNALKSFEELADYIRSLNPGEAIEVQVIRQGENKTFTGTIGERTLINTPKMRFFQDLEGMDENGDMWYNLEFDTEDSGDMTFELDELRTLLDIAREQSDEGAANMMYERSDIIIEIDNVSPADVAAINQDETKIKTDNNLEMSSVAFFPNPSNGQFNLKVELPQQGDFLIQVFNSQGAIVFEETKGNFSGNYAQTLDLSTYPDGTYYLQLLQNGKSYTKKLVKNS
jgi:hypothetical protein